MCFCILLGPLRGRKSCCLWFWIVMHFEHSTAAAGSERVDAYAYASGQRAVEVIICMITRDFSVISMTSQASLSLSLLLTKVTHAQYRKRFRASYNTERERERERERRKWRHHCRAKFCTSPCQKCAPQYWRRVLRFSLPKFCTSVSHLLKCAEFTLSIAKNVALFETVRILRTVKWRDWQGIEAGKHTIEFPAAPFFFLVEKIEKWIKLIPKTIGNRKRDCAWGCAWGINTTWENLQIEKHKSGRRSFRSPNWFVLFDLQISQVVFIPQAQPHAQSLFLFPIVFGIN